MTRDLDFRGLGYLYREVANGNMRLPALIREDVVISHGDMWQIARAMAFRMRGLGVCRSSIVVLNSSDVVFVVCMLLATSLLGAKFIAASKTVAKSRLVRPTHFFRTAEAAGKKGLDFTLIDESWLPTDASRLHPDDFEGQYDLDDDWMYVHTTGTTGKPKFIALSVCPESS